VRGIGKQLTAGECIVGSCIFSVATGCYWGIEWEGR